MGETGAAPLRLRLPGLALRWPPEGATPKTLVGTNALSQSAGKKNTAGPRGYGSKSKHQEGMGQHKTPGCGPQVIESLPFAVEFWVPISDHPLVFGCPLWHTDASRTFGSQYPPSPRGCQPRPGALAHVAATASHLSRPPWGSPRAPLPRSWRCGWLRNRHAFRNPTE